METRVIVHYLFTHVTKASVVKEAVIFQVHNYFLFSNIKHDYTKLHIKKVYESRHLTLASMRKCVCKFDRFCLTLGTSKSSYVCIYSHIMMNYKLF